MDAKRDIFREETMYATNVHIGVLNVHKKTFVVVARMDGRAMVVGFRVLYVRNELL